jgi:predicted lipoprotein with Yx(FWY)xxD motif
MRRIAAFGLLATAMLASGCGDDNAEERDGGRSEATMKPSPRGTPPPSAAANPGRTVKVVDTEYGPVVADEQGEAFYLFDKEESPRPECFGECAVAWPPVLTKGEPRAGNGAEARLLGTTRRPDGKLQVTYAGHPLYYYVDDSPGVILCQNVSEFGGLWLVVTPGGAPVI